MPVRATKRGAERTRFASDAATDVLICGASFAGLAVARELRARGARVLVLDRYEIGERQTSACAAPTEWLLNLGLDDSIRQTFGSLLVHTPSGDRPLAAAVDVLDLRLPDAVRAAVGPERRRRVRDRQGGRAHRQRRPHRPRRRARARDRGRARLAAGARAGRERAAAGGARCRAGWRSIRTATRRRPRAVARPPLHLARLRLVVPGARRAADRRRLVRPAPARQGPDADAGRRRGGRRRALPGQLDPAPAAAGDRGRRVLRRRLGRPLPAADRRGHPHRPLLRRRLRARAAGRARRAPGPGRGAAALPRLLGVATGCRSSPCTTRSSRCGGCTGRR